MSVQIADPPPTTSSTPSLESPNEESSQTPHLILKPSKGWIPIDFYQIWLFRDLLLSLASRDIKLRYKQTALGAAWVIFQPLMAAIIFTVVFTTLGKLGTEDVNPFLFQFTSLIWWTAFSTTLGKVSGVLIANSNLVSKVYFPRLVLPLSVVFSVLVDVGVSLAMLFLMLIVYRVVPGWPILTFPIWLFLGLMFAVGIGLNAAALMVFYRDVGYILPVIVQFMTYASPVAYPLSQVMKKGGPTIALLFNLNPLTGLLEAFRWSFFGTSAPSMVSLIYSVLATAFFFFTGAYQFRRMEKRFADVI